MPEEISDRGQVFPTTTLDYLWSPTCGTNKLLPQIGSAEFIAGAMIGPLPKSSIGAAGRLLARAFAADPVITYFFDDPVRRPVAFPAFFRAVIFETLDSGHVYGVWEAARLVGVAVWAPPNIIAPTAMNRLYALVSRTIVRTSFPGRSRKLYGGFAATAPLHPVAPHWYLAFVGVEPQQQAHGFGRKLLAPVLELADCRGTACYLETPFFATLEFYRRLGFVVQAEARPFENAPPIWTMVRRPSGSNA